MHKIHFILFAAIAITAFACSKKDAVVPNNGFVDIFPSIAGKWRVVKRVNEDKSIDSNINHAGVAMFFGSIWDSINFISHDTLEIKRGGSNSWYKEIITGGESFYLLDWYRSTLTVLNGGNPRFIIRPINNKLMEWHSYYSNKDAYPQYYFER